MCVALHCIIARELRVYRGEETEDLVEHVDRRIKDGCIRATLGCLGQIAVQQPANETW